VASTNINASKRFGQFLTNADLMVRAEFAPKVRLKSFR